MRALCLLLSLLSPAATATTIADLIAEDKLRLSSRLEPAGGIVPGQEVRLLIEVSTPRWFAGGTRITPPEVDGLVVLRRNEFAVNLSRREAGTTWVIQQWQLELYPQRAGVFEIPPVGLELAVNDADAGIVSGALATRAKQFSAVAPSAMQGVDKWLATPSLTLRQQFDREPIALLPGDAFTRRIEIVGTRLVAMMLPAAPADAPPGLAAYPELPQLEDRSNRGEATAIRRQTITYVVESPGRYELPPVSLSWWNTATRQRELAELPAIEVEAGASWQAPVTLPARDWSALLFIATTALLLAVSLFVLLTLRRRPLSVALRQLRRGNAAGASRALYTWLNTQQRQPHWLSLRDTAAELGERSDIDTLLRAGFSENAENSPGNIRPLVRKLRLLDWRARCRREAGRRGSRTELRPDQPRK